MRRRLLLNAADVLRRSFFTFLDISGLLLGVFLVGLGWWSISGRAIQMSGGYLILAIGIAALFAPCGHYFQLKLT